MKITHNNLTPELHSILIGLLLGDGSLYKSSLTSNVRFEMSFGSKYEEYSTFIGSLFSQYMRTPVKSIEIKGSLDKVYTQYRLKTKTLPLFNNYHNMFYKLDPITNKYHKIVPILINDLMNPIVLAYLIQGDGNYDNSRNRIRIYTNSFKKEDVINLANAIHTKLNIYTGVLHDRKDQ